MPDERVSGLDSDLAKKPGPGDHATQVAAFKNGMVGDEDAVLKDLNFDGQRGASGNGPRYGPGGENGFACFTYLM